MHYESAACSKHPTGHNVHEAYIAIVAFYRAMAVIKVFFLFRDLMEELVIYIREAVDRKQENMRRRRRRDALRLQLVRVFELVAEYGTFGIR
jgi:hypothetical protein